MTNVPPVADLVPQSGPMCLLTRVREAGPDWIACDVEAGGSRALADADGRLGIHVAIEWLAQAAAAHGGLTLRDRGEPARVGFLLGTRRLSFHGDSLDPGAAYVARARHLRGERGLVVYDCALEDARGNVKVEGRLNVYVADELPGAREALS